MHILSWLLGIAVVANAMRSGVGQKKPDKQSVTSLIGGNTASRTTVKLAANSKPDALGPDQQDLAVDGGGAKPKFPKGSNNPKSTISTPATQVVSKRVASSTRTRNPHPPKLTPKVKSPAAKTAFKPGASCPKDSIKLSPDDQDDLSTGINLESQKILEKELDAAFKKANPGRKTKILRGASKSASKTANKPTNGRVATPTKAVSRVAGHSKRAVASRVTASGRSPPRSIGSHSRSASSKSPGGACKTRSERDSETPDLEILEVQETSLPELLPPFHKIGVITTARNQSSQLSSGDARCIDQEVMTVTHKTAMCYSRVGARHVATGISCTTTLTSVETGQCLTATTTEVVANPGAPSGHLPLMAQPTPATDLPPDTLSVLPPGADALYGFETREPMCSWSGASMPLRRLFDNGSPICTRESMLDL